MEREREREREPGGERERKKGTCNEKQKKGNDRVHKTTKTNVSFGPPRNDSVTSFLLSFSPSLAKESSPSYLKEAASD